ncbi:uncharacterized protein PpBr36_09548 [Pyricularia pennisetigena]|uniref:uncharacterized protein n=1 Tax=Pyricularia pennisetigena TaxID=1578925 RepID=UPI001154496E|nr:uncharacterized protein PpBr36_09548 [Pyricularia pennisetigena]TLS22082.1 hypothetical protein PpBr36_09548 [Pyricularia pennisetigena]
MTSPADPKDTLRRFVSSVKQFCQEESFQQLAIILKDYDALQDDLSGTKTAYKKNLEELTQLKVETKAKEERLSNRIVEQNVQHRQVLEDKAATDEKLKSEQVIKAKLESRIDSLEKKLEQMAVDGKKQEDSIANQKAVIQKQSEKLEVMKKKVVTVTNNLESVTSQLGTKSEALKAIEDHLAVFKSYTATLTSLERKKGDISQMLGSLFNDAYALFNEFLEVDLDKNCLEDSKSWERTRGHVAIHYAFPLPASNVAPAKKMRVVAGLTIYSRTLTTHVFRSNHLFLNLDVEEVLETLHTKDALQGALVRAVLLKVLPDLQRKNQEACVKSVVNEVYEVVAGLMPPDLHVKFRARLGQLTTALCGNWEAVQALHERIQPCFALESEDDWKRLPIIPDLAAQTTKGAKPTQRQKEDKQHQHRYQDTKTSTILNETLAKVVWPAFLAIEEDGASELVSCGYVILPADFEEAATEDTRKRVMRKSTREANPGVKVERKRRDSAVFLSSEPSS